MSINNYPSQPMPVFISKNQVDHLPKETQAKERILVTSKVISYGTALTGIRNTVENAYVVSVSSNIPAASYSQAVNSVFGQKFGTERAGVEPNEKVSVKDTTALSATSLNIPMAPPLPLSFTHKGHQQVTTAFAQQLGMFDSDIQPVSSLPQTKRLAEHINIFMNKQTNSQMFGDDLITELKAKISKRNLTSNEDLPSPSLNSEPKDVLPKPQGAERAQKPFNQQASPQLFGNDLIAELKAKISIRNLTNNEDLPSPSLDSKPKDVLPKPQGAGRAQKPFNQQASPQLFGNDLIAELKAKISVLRVEKVNK